MLAACYSSAMKIDKDEIDEFTGQRTLITSWESACKNNIHFRFRLENGFELLDFKLVYDDAIVIGKGDKLMFKSTTDNIGTFTSVAAYSGAKGAGSVGINKSGMWGISATYQGDLSYFASDTTRILRIYTTDGYINKELNESDGIKLEKLYTLFASSIGKDVGSFTKYVSCTLVFLRSKNGGKTWEEVKQEYLTDASSTDISDLINEWKSQSSGKMLYDVQVKKDR